MVKRQMRFLVPMLFLLFSCSTPPQHQFSAALEVDGQAYSEDQVVIAKAGERMQLKVLVDGLSRYDITGVTDLSVKSGWMTVRQGGTEEQDFIEFELASLKPGRQTHKITVTDEVTQEQRVIQLIVEAQ